MPFDGWDDSVAARSGETWLPKAIGSFVALGLILRVAAYLLDFPLWWDEAFVGVNLLRRGYLGLLRPLDYGQVCPLLFLWAELTAVRWLGFSEWSLRLFPLLSALGGMVLFRVMAGMVLRGRSLLLAVAIFAVAAHPIKHAADVKPYASDSLVAVALMTLAIAWWRDPARARWLWALAGFAPIALLLSHTAPFVAGGIGLALVVPAWKSRRTNVRAAFAMYGLALVTTYALIFFAFTKAQASSASPGMRGMWARSFPPLDSATGLVRWLVVAHSGDMMAYPCGGEGGASTLSLLACLIGAVILWKRGRSVILGCCLAPLALAMVAAALHLYPYGGPAPHGSAARIMQYAAPGLCLLIGLGSSRVLGRISSVPLRNRIFRLGCVGLVIVGVAPVAAGLARPYRSYHAEAAREFARGFWPEVGDGAEVACLRWDYEVADWDSIQLGIAVSLCNQAIYSPSRREGGPRWERVSSRRPLRCVLGVAPEGESPKIASWLEAMRMTHELQSRRTIEVDTAESGRRPNLERYEVFEFLPRAEIGQGSPETSIRQRVVEFRTPALGD